MNALTRVDILFTIRAGAAEAYADLAARNRSGTRPDSCIYGLIREGGLDQVALSVYAGILHISLYLGRRQRITDQVTCQCSADRSPDTDCSTTNRN
jgi:hypothetical protein